MTDGPLMEAVEALWDSEIQLVFECVRCRERFVEDDLQQLQPEGRYGCPICEEWFADTFIVIPSRGLNAQESPDSHPEVTP